MEWLITTCDAIGIVGVIDWMAAYSVTDVVFVFLCSKPVFVFAALLVGLRSHLADADPPTKRIPADL